MSLLGRSMPPTQETLFSLELMIGYVRLDGSRGNVLDPAVGVRLLDFPTLLIYKSGREDPSKSGYADLRGSPEALPQPDDLKYPFQKGKSCLFRINLDSLHTHLLNTPLYAMVLDVKDEIPRFIGSSLISLAKVMERVKLDVDKHGINNPTAHGERLISPICNLMGKSIGVISLAYKIVSLGAHLIPHIPDNRVYEVGVTPNCERVHGEKDDVVPEIHNVLSQQISLDGQLTDIVISEAKQPGVPAYTQTEQAVQSVSWSEDAQEYTAFCPPPMFYCSNENNQQERKSLHTAMESLNIEDQEDENDEEESLSDMPEIPEVDRWSKLTSTPKSQRTETDSAPLVDVIRQLPLLNALLVELSQLNVQTPHQQPLSIHPNLAWLYTPQPAGKPKTDIQKTSPKQSKGRIKRGIKSMKSAKTDEQKLQPKRKLKYGLTNTFRLRLKLAKLSPAKQHECIEYHDVKQDQQKKQRFSDVRKPVSRGVKLDEAVETVMSRFEINPSKSQTRPSAKESHDASQCSLTERDKKVDIPKSDQHSVSSNANNPGSKGNKEDSRQSSRPHLSNNDEYQDDFTSLNTTDGYSRHSGSSISGSKALPVPAKAENSPQRSLKSTHIIRPRLQTSALSVSSENSEDESCRLRSQSSGRNTPSVRRTFGKSQSFDSDSAEKGMTFGRLSEDSDLPANKPVLKSISLSEEQDKLGSLELDRNYHHISELVINKLPGYTL